jgi:hypothetical protein
VEGQIARLVSEAVPALAALRGVGTDTAASLLVAVGDNPERLKSKASFALLCGMAPVPASSGKTVRHRLNRGGNRDANRALDVLVLGRMSWDERTQEYVARRTAEGKSKREGPISPPCSCWQARWCSLTARLRGSEGYARCPHRDQVHSIDSEVVLPMSSTKTNRLRVHLLRDRITLLATPRHSSRFTAPRSVFGLKPTLLRASA